MNSTEIFSIALGLSSPWYVEKVEFLNTSSESSHELHLYLNFERGYKFLDNESNETTAYDTVNRKWQHLNFFQHNCFLHARVPRIKNSDGTINQVSTPWARPSSGFTLLFEAYAMLLIESEAPISRVASNLRVTQPRVWRVFDYWIDLAKSKDDLSEVSKVGVDETSSKKGHNYVSVFADMDAHRVVHVCEGKDASTIHSFTESLENKGGKKENIEVISMDMSPSFISGAVKELPNAKIVFDKFHLVQSLNKSLDEVRIKERKSNDLLKGHKYTVLKKYDKLSNDKQWELDHLLMMYPTLGEAYRMREMFMDIFNIADSQEAKAYLMFWCDMVSETTITPFKKFAAMIKSHWTGVVAYFDNGISNGILEGINSKIQLAKRRARGYRKIKNFINMIYFLTGKLKYDYPLDSL